MAHEHHHGSSSKNIAVAFVLNLSFAVFELLGGIYTNSVAITSDALHDFGDSISLGLAWYFEKIAKRKRTKNYSYGYKRFSVLGAIINSMILLLGSFVVLYETVPRLFNPVQSDVKGMFVLACVGVAVNGFAALRLRGGHSLNERTVSLHLLEDVLGWVAILIGSVVMYFVDFPILDPILSVVITLYVLYNVVKNLRSISKVILQAVPEGVDMESIKQSIERLPDVVSVQDIHVWTMDSHYNVLSLHAVVESNAKEDEIKTMIRTILKNNFSIQHTTIELEKSGEECWLCDC